MQLSLRENIKKYRKSMGLTQEELAEAFGVTVGAVSKWESGSTVPDILTLMELADFFSISMDVLLGYSMSSKKVEEITGRIDALLQEDKREEVIAETEKALVRYPGSFVMLYKAGEVYAVLATISKADRKSAEAYNKRAIEVYEKSLRYMSQNTDPDINEVTVRMMIAELKMRRKPEESLEELRKINYFGIADIGIAMNLLKLGRTEEAMNSYTKVLVSLLVKSVEYAMSMMVALTKTDRPSAFRETVELMDWSITLLDATGNGEISYLTKMKVTMLMMKSLALSCLKEYEDMRTCIDEAYELATLYDSAPANELAGKIKFWHGDEDFHPVLYDQMGIYITDGIDKMLANKPEQIPANVIRKMEEASKYWMLCRGRR